MQGTWNVERDLSVVIRGVPKKIVWGCEVYYKADEEDDGREKNMGFVW
jgi:hypothetical protein